jgi:hypothetical protein
MEEFRIERPRFWQAEEVEKLRVMAPDHSLSELSLALRRSPGAVATKALQEKIRFKVMRPGPDAPASAGSLLVASLDRRLMKARWIDGLWRTPKATATFYEGDETKLPQDFRKTGGWADIEPAPGFSNVAADQAIERDGYYIWPQTVVG